MHFAAQILAIFGLILPNVLAAQGQSSPAGSDPDASSPNRSSSAPSNPANQICGVFDKVNRDNELAWLKYEFVNSAPSRDLGTLNRIEIVRVEETTSLGPIYVGGERPRLEIGPNFMKNLCMGAALTIGLLQDPARFPKRMDAAMATCRDGGGKPLDCYRKGIIAASEGLKLVMPEMARDIPGPNDPTSVMLNARQNTVGMARFLLAHEAGHAIFRAPGSKYDLAAMDEEYEADVFAYLYTLSSDAGAAMAVLQPLANQGAINQFFSIPEEDTHEGLECRLRQSVKIQRRLIVPVARLQLIEQSNGEAEEAIGALAKLLEVALPNLPPDPNCADQVDSKIEQLGKDVEFTLSMLTGAGPDSMLDASRIDTLLDYEFASQSGRQFAINVAVAIAAKQLQNTWGFDPKTIKSPTPEAISAMGDASRLLFKFYDGDAGEFVGPIRLSQARFVQSLSSFIAKPKGTPAIEANRAFVKEMRDNFEFFDPLTEAGHAVYTQRIFSASRDIGTFSPSDVFAKLQIYIGLSFGTGNCDDARDALNLTAKVTQILVPGGSAPPKITDAMCEAQFKNTLKQQAAMFGWKIPDQPSLQ